MNLNFSPQTKDAEAAVKLFNDPIQWAGSTAMPGHAGILKSHNCPILIKPKTEEKRNYFIQGGTNYEYLKAKDNLTQQHRISKNSATKMTASSHPCQVLHQHNPLLPTEGNQKN
jgi:hypothetical protein